MKHPASLFAALMLICLLSAASGWADDTVTSAPAETTPTPADNKTDTWRHFENLVNTINQAREDMAALRKQLQETKDEAERERIDNELTLLAADIDSLQAAWEMWATGGVDMQLFAPKTDQKFDWREEIQSVFEPIVVELRRLTERPRKIERLRSEQLFYQQRYAAAETALRNVVDYRTRAPTPDLAEAFGALEERWQKRRDDLQSRLQLTDFELEELLAPSRPGEEKTGEVLQELLSGRLVNLLLAVLAAALTYTVLWLLSRAYSRYTQRRGYKRSFLARAMHLAYMVVALILALFAAMAVLYARGDWILLGLLLIMLVGAALTLQRSLPGYFNEAKLLLNVGPVREGERVIYQGLPWKVQTLSMNATLVNPLLRGGRIAVPVSTLFSLTSRAYDEREAWFPSRENDIVILSDNTHGRVVLQTPECVQMRVGGAIKTYPTSAFLDSKPQNLSLEGFGVSVTFGVDYRHQAAVMTDMPAVLKDYIGARLKAHALGAQLQDCSVEFDAPAASSLNLVVSASFAGEAAESYHAIRRLLHGLVVEACAAHGWVMPYDQLTVHLTRAETPSMEEGAEKTG